MAIEPEFDNPTSGDDRKGWRYNHATGRALLVELQPSVALHIDDFGTAGAGGDDTAVFNAAIAALNSLGGSGPATPGPALVLPSDSSYIIPGSLDPILVDGVSIIGPGSQKSCVINGTSNPIFTVGSSAQAVLGFTLRGVDFAYPYQNADATGRPLKIVNVSGVHIADLRLYEAAGLLEMEAPSGGYAADVWISNVTGNTANVATPTIWSHGTGVSSGLYLHGVRLYPANVVNPAESGTTPHSAVSGNAFLQIDTQFDTVIATDCVINRYGRGIKLNAATAGHSIGNIYFSEFIADYCNTAMELICAGGTIVRVRFNSGWLNSTDGRTVQLTRTSGDMISIEVSDSDFMMAGTENVVIPAGSDGVIIKGNRIFGGGRFGSSVDSIRAESGASNFDISLNRWEDSAAAYGTGRYCDRGIVVSSGSDACRIEGNLVRANTTGYVIPTTASNAHRSIGGNMIVGGYEPEGGAHGSLLRRSTLPTASATYLGQIRVKTGTGVEDKVCVCVLSADGTTHKWVNVTDGSTVT